MPSLSSLLQSITSVGESILWPLKKSSVFTNQSQMAFQTTTNIGNAIYPEQIPLTEPPIDLAIIEQYGNLILGNLKFLYNEAKGWMHLVFENDLNHVDSIHQCYVNLLALPLSTMQSNYQKRLLSNGLIELPQLENKKDEPVNIPESQPEFSIEDAVSHPCLTANNNLENLIDHFIDRALIIIKKKRTTLKEDDELKLLEILVYYLIEYSLYHNIESDEPSEDNDRFDEK